MIYEVKNGFVIRNGVHMRFRVILLYWTPESFTIPNRLPLTPDKMECIPPLHPHIFFIDIQMVSL